METTISTQVLGFVDHPPCNSGIIGIYRGFKDVRVHRYCCLGELCQGGVVLGVMLLVYDLRPCFGLRQP